MKNKRTFAGVFLIPLCFVITAFLLDALLFLIIAVPFPQYWLTSFLLVLGVAILVSCIPNRIVQFCIFMFVIAWQTVTTIANLIAYNNLGEIFILETLRSFREIIGGAGAARYDGTWHYFLVGLVIFLFIFACIFTMIKCKHQRPGCTRHSFVAVSTAFILCVGGIVINFFAINKNPEKDIDKLIDPHFSIMNFSNRSRALYSFGQPMFYLHNLICMLGLKADNVSVFGNEDRGWDELPKYEFALNKDYNLIMLMMETIEFDAIDPILTENLWKIKSGSTWVDGYYATERTAFTEYVSLAGNYAMGVEMWRDKKHVAQTNSLPNIFRRAWEEDKANGGKDFRIGGFHTYDSDFYNRDIMFTKERNGMDFMRDMSYYNLEVDFSFSNNSDVAFFGSAIEDIAPSDGTRFLSYVLGVSTHSPHFKASYLVRDKDGYKSSPYADSLEYVITNFDYFADKYPKLKSKHAEVVDATVAYLVSVREYDQAVGVILDHLESKGLMDTTALVFYSDHFNYISYKNTYNVDNGGLLSSTSIESPIGEKCVFMLYNPRDKQERKITSFMANTDIYKTITHLYNIDTHRDYTLGQSILTRLGNDDYRISAGIGFYNGLFFGTDLADPTLHFATRDFKTYMTNKSGVMPSQETLDAYYERLDDYATAILKTRRHFDKNTFKNQKDVVYNIS